jgi:hypothetical protein
MAQQLVASKEFAWLAEMSFGADDFADAQSGGRGELADQLSIRDNVFTFKTSDGTTEAPNPRQLYFVYLGGKKPKSRALYQGAFNDDDLQAPICTSQDGVSFEPGSQEPVITDPAHPHVGQATRGCKECPMSKWGSAISVKTGKAVPACKEHKDIVVKVMGVPGAWLFKLPPAAFNNWDKATSKLRAAIEADKAGHGGKTSLSLGNCIFTVVFGPGMGNLIFEPKGYVQGDELLEVVTLRRDPDAVDKMLWGPEGTARRMQYEGGARISGSTGAQYASDKPYLDLAPPANAAAASLSTTPQNKERFTTFSSDPVVHKVAAHAAAAVLEKQAASEALDNKPYQDSAPVKVTKKSTKPNPYKDVASILSGMGLPTE